MLIISSVVKFTSGKQPLSHFTQDHIVLFIMQLDKLKAIMIMSNEDFRVLDCANVQLLA